MRFYDPTRQRVNDAPCWSGVGVVLPWVELMPEEGGRWRASVIVPTGDGGFAYVERRVEEMKGVVAMLAAWEAGPEEALKVIWGRELGEGKIKQVAAVEMDI